MGCMKIISVVHTYRLYIIIKRCCPTDDLVFKIHTHLLMELNTNFQTHAKPKCITWLTIYTATHLNVLVRSGKCSETISPVHCTSFLVHTIMYKYFEKRLHVMRMRNILIFLWCLCIKITLLSIFFILPSNSTIWDLFWKIWVLQNNSSLTKKTLPWQIFSYYVGHV